MTFASGAKRLDRALPTPVISPPPPIAAIDRPHLRQRLDDLQSHGSVAGMKWWLSNGWMKVPSRPSNACASAAFQALLIGHGRLIVAPSARILVELGLRRGLDRDHRAGNAADRAGIGDALPGVAGADRPDAACPLLIRQLGDRIGTRRGSCRRWSAGDSPA
jgi:hypothetical protein